MNSENFHLNENDIRAILAADRPLFVRMQAAERLRLPQWWFAGGCIYQSIWNSICGFASGNGIKDYDLIFFDALNLSESYEKLIDISLEYFRMDGCGPINAKNQARLQYWFRPKFGVPSRSIASSTDALRYFLSPLHAVAARLDDNVLTLEAPFGWTDVVSRVVRPNYSAPGQTNYEKKAASLAERWPGVTVHPWIREVSTDA